MRKIKYSIIIFFLVSCSSLKTKQDTNTKTDRIINEKTRTIIKRAKDSVVLVPNYYFKDTTIIKRGKTTKLIQQYNSEGRVIRTDCISDEINEIKETLRQIVETEKTKNKSKTKEFKMSNVVILYVFLGITFLIIVNKIINKIINIL